MTEPPLDMFMRFNKKPVQDRQIDTLIGLAKGITADGIVNQVEAEFLHEWLVLNRLTIQDNPIFQYLFNRVSTMLEDGVLDSDEQTELFSALRSVSGDRSQGGEFMKSSLLPIDQPEPDIMFLGKRFLFTGTCARGTRRECESEVEKRGGINEKIVTKRLDYLVLGTYVTPSWKHETYGNKIEKAMQYRDEHGVPLAIVTEGFWAMEAGL